jgi:selenocysteine-specific elongation factor
MKKHTIIGTAGHIDHGKTALIKALTDIDTDRLKEEKERGITIDIGFAYWKEDVTIIDVPGHEKFIRNMVAGVSTIDFFILVIAADDGIMPQTIEHLDILKFFNIKDGIVVINKIDLVDEEWLALITDEISNLLDKYELENLPIVQVSSIKGINVDKFKVIVEEKIENHDKSVISRPFRLLIDRSFSIKGFGTVVTGTVLSGTLNTGDDIQILSSGFETKVRGLQEHTTSVKSVQVGDRAAVNLQNIPKEGVGRGDVLVKPNTLTAITEFTGLIHSVSKVPIKIKNRCRVRVHIGTSERLGKLLWFDDVNTLEPDKNYHVRIQLESPVAAARNDAILVRLHSPLITLAGGKVLEINPPKLKKSDSSWLQYFENMKSDNLVQITETIIKNEKLQPVSFNKLQNKLFEESDIISTTLSTLNNKKKLKSLSLKGTEQYIHADNFNAFADEVMQFITNFHKEYPHKPGTNLQEIIGGFKRRKIETEVFELTLRKLINSETITLNQNIYALKGFKIQVSKDTNAAKTELLNILDKAMYECPAPDEMAEKMEISKNEIYSLIQLLTTENQIIQVNNVYFVHIKNWDKLLIFLRIHFDNNKEIEVSHLKEFVKTSRKYVIPLFEFLDSQDITRRVGNAREKGNSL